MVERRIGKESGFHYSSPGMDMFYSMAYAKKLFRQKLGLAKLSIRYLRDTLTLKFFFSKRKVFC